MRRGAWSLAAVYPTVAEVRDALAKGLAPESSRLRRMRAEESPEPDLKDRYLLTSAAPASVVDSEEEPALGNVREMVDVADAVSVITVSPLGRVVTDVELAVAACGEVEGRLYLPCRHFGLGRRSPASFERVTNKNRKDEW